jgi:hypothetical protein
MVVKCVFSWGKMLIYCWQQGDTILFVNRADNAVDSRF